MKCPLKNSVFIVLIANYLAVGVIGHLTFIALTRLDKSDDQVAASKQNNRSNGKAYWTQHKHIASEVKITKASLAINSDHNVPSAYSEIEGDLIVKTFSTINRTLNSRSSRSPPSY